MDAVIYNVGDTSTSYSYDPKSDFLGEGQFGNVYRARPLDGVHQGVQLALKIAKDTPDGTPTPGQMAHFSRLVNLMLHLDIKPSNVLMAMGDDQDERMLLGDVDDIRSMRDHHTTSQDVTSMCGTVGFISPEILRRDMQLPTTNPGRPSDLWSTGCLFLKIAAHVTGDHTEVIGRGEDRQPVAAIAPARRLMLMADGYVPLTPAVVPEEIAAIIRRCLVVDSTGRISARELFSVVSSCHREVETTENRDKQTAEVQLIITILQTNRNNDVTESFIDMRLKQDLLRGVSSYGFKTPSAIQRLAIVPCLKGRDVIAQSLSETGKTATFAVSVLQIIDTASFECQALVLAPTRGMAEQVKTMLLGLGRYLDVRCYVCVNSQHGVVKLDQCPHVVVGTPDHVHDLISQRAVSVNALKMFVLDEAEKTLALGFKEHIYDIFKILPAAIQMVLLSATMTPDVLEVAEKVMRDPIRISAKTDELALEGIHQFFVDVHREDWKFETLCDLYSTVWISQSIIFCNTHEKAESLTSQMQADSHTVSSMYGEVSKEEREVIMREFRSGMSRVLITTDRLTRGIDVQSVNLIINYDLPNKCEDYIHRVGHGGRIGRTGKSCAVSFVTREDVRHLKEIEQYYNTKIEEMPSNIADLL
ncbi:uncharacterized protein LOC129595108 [Paramacrobiotus metropolitanus]|uniref:uncharacterized protein LOC129595108 n=1 Tax=Paramacrobiotus metropolitanus TaxID=2943436 RepID=UPI002445E3AF|nr:uncharacterized protein LOC129595108 [Paramacrobiotus metropolitanus]